MNRRLRSIIYLIRGVLRFPFETFVKHNKISLKSRINKSYINNSSIGKYTYIGFNCLINHTTIGNYCSIAPGVQIGGMEHSLDWFSTSTVLSDRCFAHKETIIGDNVWIAGLAIIRQGVKVGSGSVIGAGAFVNKDVPENVIVVGSPARIIRNRLSPEMLREISGQGFWDQSPKEIEKIIGR